MYDAVSASRLQHPPLDLHVLQSPDDRHRLRRVPNDDPIGGTVLEGVARPQSAGEQEQSERGAVEGAVASQRQEIIRSSTTYWQSRVTE
jgi:hypothetical protein